MEKQFNVNNIITYWDELKEFYTTKELNGFLRELTYRELPKGSLASAVSMMILDFGEIKEPNVIKIIKDGE